jgi:hypothetical protein
MLFWLGILIGVIFAWFAVQRKFYETWAILFNLVISIYLAIFLMPVIVDFAPAAGEPPYGNMLTIAATATGIFLVTQGLCFILFTSQFSIPLPKILDIIGSGFLGLFAGFLAWSFVVLLISISPISQDKIAKKIGLPTHFQQTALPYLSWWCNMVNNIVSDKAGEHTTEYVVGELLKSASPKKPAKAEKQPAASKPAEPNLPKPAAAEPNRPAESKPAEPNRPAVPAEPNRT